MPICTFWMFILEMISFLVIVLHPNVYLVLFLSRMLVVVALPGHTQSEDCATTSLRQRRFSTCLRILFTLSSTSSSCLALVHSSPRHGSMSQGPAQRTYVIDDSLFILLWLSYRVLNSFAIIKTWKCTDNLYGIFYKAGVSRYCTP